MSGLEHPSDQQRAEATQAAVSAARDSRRGRSHIDFYEVIAEHWLALETAVALNAAVSALEAAGFCVKRPDHLRAAALDAARAHFWPHHIIIDSLDMDVHAGVGHMRSPMRCLRRSWRRSIAARAGSVVCWRLGPW